MITEAAANGARLHKACSVLGLSIRTYERWKKSPDKIDRRKGASKITPNKLSVFERKKILSIADSQDFASLPPSQIVPILAIRANTYVQNVHFTEY